MQIIYSANYPTALIQISSLHDSLFRVISQKSALLNATVYFFLRIIPYEWNKPAIFSQPLAFNENTIENFIDPYQMAASIYLGSTIPEYRIRFEGYAIELSIRLVVEGPNLGPTLNFTVDMSHYRIAITDYIVDSKLQNGLSIMLCGIFIAILSYTPAKYIKTKP